MVRGSPILLEELWSLKQDGLTGRKKIVMTFAFLSYSSFLQFVHELYIFPVECCRFRRPHGNVLSKGLGIGNFQLFESVALNHFGLLDSHPITILSPQNHLGAIHLGVKDPV